MPEWCSIETIELVAIKLLVEAFLEELSCYFGVAIFVGQAGADRVRRVEDVLRHKWVSVRRDISLSRGWGEAKPASAPPLVMSYLAYYILDDKMCRDRHV
jgi:hypothetical protein